MIDSDTQLCLSLAARPGGFGVRFHNYLYGELRLNFIYRSGATSDLKAAISGLRGLRIRGCGLSMPYKEQALELLDEVDPVARQIGAVNTIVNEDVQGAGRLVGYNTDAVAVRELLKARNVGPASSVAFAGSGGMARACAYALHELGCKKVTVLARNQERGQALASQYGYEWMAPTQARAAEILINATPVGMHPDPDHLLPFEPALIRAARLVVESVANPSRTALVRAARDAGVAVAEGFDITLTQGVEQFRLYTGVALRPDQVARAAVFARHQKSNIRPT